MKALGCAVVQAIVLLVIGTAIGLGANALRSRDHINLQRDYNPKMVFPSPKGTATSEAAAESPPGQSGPQPTASATSTTSTRATQTDTAPTSEPTGPTPERPFQLVTVQQALEIFDDPKTSAGAYVFVDARADDPYSAGHIPGAVQCDFYRIEQDLPTVLAYVSGVEKVVVYCNGGTCEDSQHVCIELLNSNVPWNRLFLFHGGWEEWTKNNLPVQTGKEK